MKAATSENQAAKRIVRVAVHILTGAALLTGATIAAAHAADGHEGQAFQSGNLEIAFVDPSGNPQGSPLLGVENAYPGMDPQRTMIELRNTGDLPLTHSVASRLHQVGSGSLDQVLVVTVKNESESTVYHGDLSGLSFHGSHPLAPGESARYTVQVTWPETGSNDDRYQGQTLSFDLRASAEAA